MKTGYRCDCCLLLFDRAFSEGHCTTCKYHQGSEINQTAKRHREHEQMLRERLKASTEWASNAEVERRAFGEKMHWALKSRDRSIRVLRQISDLHELRSDGTCKCGSKRSCKIAGILDDRGVQMLISRVDELEAEYARKEQLMRELEATGDPDAWEQFLRGSGTDRGTQRRDTA